jgi:hypothetical protein
MRRHVEDNLIASCTLSRQYVFFSTSEQMPRIYLGCSDFSCQRQVPWIVLTLSSKFKGHCAYWIEVTKGGQGNTRQLSHKEYLKSLSGFWQAGLITWKRKEILIPNYVYIQYTSYNWQRLACVCCTQGFFIIPNTKAVLVIHGNQQIFNNCNQFLLNDKQTNVTKAMNSVYIKG